MKALKSSPSFQLHTCIFVFIKTSERCYVLPSNLKQQIGTTICCMNLKKPGYKNLVWPLVWLKNTLSSLKSCSSGNPNAFYNDSTLFFLYNDLAFGFSGTLIQIFWFSYFLRRRQLAEIISSQQMNINLDWGEQNHFKLGVINPENNKSGPCIRVSGGY